MKRSPKKRYRDPMIFHLDLDSFFVSAERIRDPKLRGKCVAVGGRGDRGVISSASYEARKLGVRSAMPTAQARRLCPTLIVLPPNFELYSKLSGEVFEIVARFAPVFEAVSIDEGYLDMRGTSSLWGPPLEAAAKIKGEILAQTGLTCSIGIASNRRVAKVATDACKPNGMLLIEPGKEAEFLAPMPVRCLPGIGPSTERDLHSRGIFRLSDLQKRPNEELHEAALGQGSTEFHAPAKTRSVSRERTFDRNLRDPVSLEKELWEIASELGRELRDEGVLARVLRLKLRYPPFETVNRSRTLEEPTHSDSTLYEGYVALFRENWDDSRPLRLLGAGAVVTDAPAQLDLFADQSALRRRERIDGLKDQLKKRFGEDAIRTGRDMLDKKEDSSDS